MVGSAGNDEIPTDLSDQIDRPDQQAADSRERHYSAVADWPAAGLLWIGSDGFGLDGLGLADLTGLRQNGLRFSPEYAVDRQSNTYGNCF